TRKRTHLKPNQLTVLQNSFAVNPLPEAPMRNQLARELGVNQRTIQIWFQNRRAKARKLEQARLHNQPRYQPTFRTMMTPELFEELKQQPPSTRRTNGNRPRSSSKPEKQDQQQKETTTVTATERADKTGNNNNSNNEHSSDIVPLLNIQSLRIGSWSRFCGQPAVMGQQATPPCSWDLKCFVESTNKTLTWQVLAEGHLFRIQVPMDTIAQVRLVQEGQLEIELDDPRHCCFAMYDNNSNNSSQGEWIRCGDFSEDKQASRETVHVLLGNHDVLQQALLDLAALAPELTAKMVLTPLPLMDDDLVSCSPSVTPEPLL
ncbi:homeobox domain-containing protein, partial [Zychaea mexicana]|uniref:homeobox domain-containing protein n=1 Tax=Zychaea mexicana TaxID=64656 RepID=UPI0022FE0DE5